MILNDLQRFTFFIFFCFPFIFLDYGFFGGIQLIAIGIFGQYLARINDNVLSRSHYIISRQSK